MEKSTLTVAYEYLSEAKESKSFQDIWNHVKEELQISDEGKNISKFYTNLTLDGRFVCLNENMWDLRERVKYDIIDKKNKEMNEFYADEDVTYKENEDDEDDIDNDEAPIVEEDVSEGL